MSDINDLVLVQEIQKLYKAGKISFSSVTHKTSHNHYWIPNEPGDTMVDLYRTDFISINKCIEITQEVISSYKDLAEHLVKQPSQFECFIWIVCQLPTWILGSGLILETQIRLILELLSLPWSLSKNCEVSHGNVIGDHLWKQHESLEPWILVTPNNFKSRPRGYDFVWSICWWLTQVNNICVRETLLSCLAEEYRKNPKLVKLCILEIFYGRYHGKPWEVESPRLLRTHLLSFLFDEV